MEDNKVVQGQQEDFAEEMQEAQKTGIVSMEDKKKEKKTSLNYTHTFKAPAPLCPGWLRSVPGCTILLL